MKRYLEVIKLMNNMRQKKLQNEEESLKTYANQKKLKP